MSTITEEAIAQFQTHLEPAWAELSQSVSTACGKQVEFRAGAIQIIAPVEALGAAQGPVISIQFEVAQAGSNAQAFLFAAENVAKAGTLFAEGAPPDDEENIVPEIRPTLEAIVQGICKGLSKNPENALIASDLAIRCQSWVQPAQWEGQTQLAEVTVEIQVGEESLLAKWFFDPASIAFLNSDTQLEDGIEIPFEQIQEEARDRDFESANGLDRLMDIPLEISVELGRVKLLVRDIVDLGPGSIIEVNKAAGEPVDVLVNGRVVARGEVVIIEDNFGVRITEILNRADRLNRISEVA